MENNKGKLWEKGVIIALILIVFQLILHFTGQEQNAYLGWISIVLFLGCIIYTNILYSKEQNGQVTFGNLFAHGFKVAAIVTLIMLVWAVLMYKVIFPDMQDKMAQIQREAGLKKGYTEDQVNSGLAITKKFFMTFVIGGTILYFIIIGAIGSLLGAAFSKKLPADGSPFQQQ